jgi:hypothetical protein
MYLNNKQNIVTCWVTIDGVSIGNLFYYTLTEPNYK